MQLRRKAARRRGTRKPIDAGVAMNKAAARLILSDETKHGGPDSLMVQWAMVILQRQPEASEVEASGQMRIFAA